MISGPAVTSKTRVVIDARPVVLASGMGTFVDDTLVYIRLAAVSRSIWRTEAVVLLAKSRQASTTMLARFTLTTVH